MPSINKRAFIAAAALFSMSLAIPQVSEARTLNFSVPGYNKLIKSGKPFLLSIHTEWCSTCAVQQRVIGSLRGRGKPYSGMTELAMDWDKYRGSKIGRQLRIPRRSTLIMYDNGKEVGRIIAGTSPASIKKLIDSGLN